MFGSIISFWPLIFEIPEILCSILDKKSKVCYILVLLNWQVNLEAVISDVVLYTDEYQNR